MVAHNSSNNDITNISTISTTTTEICKQNLSKKKGKDSLRWRSTGWTPLAYPASSLIINASSYDSILVTDSIEVNPFFPLDKDVLRAAMREMLILDGSICADTLKLKPGRTRFQKSSAIKMYENETCFAMGPGYASHLDPTKWVSAKEDQIFIRAETIVLDDTVNSESKRKLSSSIFVAKKKQKKRDVSLTAADDKGSTSALTGGETQIMEENLEGIPLSISSAESLVDTLLDHNRQSREDAFVVEPVLSAEVQERIVSTSQERPPRKVSDLDDHPPVLLDLTEETCGEHDISLFVDIVNRKKDGKVTFLKDEIPSFLDVSIVFESSLRNSACYMVSKICASCDIEALRLFLGYKSCALKRERILRILSDYLFDVSHAMFAWKQTESEILSERSGSTALPNIASIYQQIDPLVRDSLFDGRALKKIGGLDDSSILRHAIEISRSERRKESWERFAKTVSGRRLLSHHRSGRIYLAGQKRRGQRIKRFSSAVSATDTSEEGQRSRASSIASYEEVEITVNTTTKSSVSESPAPAQEPNIFSSTIQNLSDLLDITLTREIDKSWGVLLAREGDMCVVDRAPEKSRICCGDLILSVKNDRGETATPGTIANPNWFKEIVNVFKGSNELHLVVRRVGC